MNFSNSATVTYEPVGLSGLMMRSPEIAEENDGMMTIPTMRSAAAPRNPGTLRMGRF